MRSLLELLDEAGGTLRQVQHELVHHKSDSESLRKILVKQSKEMEALRTSLASPEQHQTAALPVHARQTELLAQLRQVKATLECKPQHTAGESEATAHATAAAYGRAMAQLRQAKEALERQLERQGAEVVALKGEMEAAKLEHERVSTDMLSECEAAQRGSLSRAAEEHYAAMSQLRAQKENAVRQALHVAYAEHEAAMGEARAAHSTANVLQQEQEAAVRQEMAEHHSEVQAQMQVQIEALQDGAHATTQELAAAEALGGRRGAAAHEAREGHAGLRQAQQRQEAIEKELQEPEQEIQELREELAATQRELGVHREKMHKVKGDSESSEQARGSMHALHCLSSASLHHSRPHCAAHCCWYYYSSTKHTKV